MAKTNCGKSFLLKPLKLIYNAFMNTAADNYAWFGYNSAEIIFDGAKNVIEWKSFLLLLEGDVVKLHCQHPKNHFSIDVCIDNETPVFATSKSVIKYRGSYNSEDQGEDAMMASRWKIFTFFHSIPEEKQKKMVACSKCFAELALTSEKS